MPLPRQQANVRLSKEVLEHMVYLRQIELALPLTLVALLMKTSEPP